MKDTVTREDVFKEIEKVEHPEIAATLIDLGMILDVAVENNVVRVAMALPMLGIPEVVRNLLVQSMKEKIEALGAKFELEFFEMDQDARNKFVTISQKNWKGAV